MEHVEQQPLGVELLVSQLELLQVLWPFAGKLTTVTLG